jgi:hypothetical protein
VQRHQPGRLDVDVAVGDEPLDELFVLELAAEHLTGVGPLDHQIERSPRLTDRVHAVKDAAGAETILRRLVSLADAAEGVLQRDAKHLRT